MERCDTNAQQPEHDETLRMLGGVAADSIAGLATYKLLKVQLVSIRNLPERLEEERILAAR
jgi:hypothetical protein